MKLSSDVVARMKAVVGALNAQMIVQIVNALFNFMLREREISEETIRKSRLRWQRNGDVACTMSIVCNREHTSMPLVDQFYMDVLTHAAGSRLIDARIDVAHNCLSLTFGAFDSLRHIEPFAPVAARKRLFLDMRQSPNMHDGDYARIKFIRDTMYHIEDEVGEEMRFWYESIATDEEDDDETSVTTDAVRADAEVLGFLVCFIDTPAIPHTLFAYLSSELGSAYVNATAYYKKNIFYVTLRSSTTSNVMRANATLLHMLPVAMGIDSRIVAAGAADDSSTTSKEPVAKRARVLL